MRVIILSFILLLCSCCPVDSNNNSIQKKSIQKKNETIVNCSNKYKIYRDTYGTVIILHEFELHGHIFLVNEWNDCKLIHAPWCPCKQTPSTTTTESIFESNSFF